MLILNTVSAKVILNTHSDTYVLVLVQTASSDLKDTSNCLLDYVDSVIIRLQK